MNSECDSERVASYSSDMNSECDSERVDSYSSDMDSECDSERIDSYSSDPLTVIVRPAIMTAMIDNGYSLFCFIIL